MNAKLTLRSDVEATTAGRPCGAEIALPYRGSTRAWVVQTLQAILPRRKEPQAGRGVNHRLTSKIPEKIYDYMLSNKVCHSNWLRREKEPVEKIGLSKSGNEFGTEFPHWLQTQINLARDIVTKRVDIHQWSHQ